MIDLIEFRGVDGNATVVAPEKIKVIIVSKNKKVYLVVDDSSEGFEIDESYESARDRWATALASLRAARSTGA